MRSQKRVFIGATLFCLLLFGATFVDPQGWPKRQRVLEALEKTQAENAQLEASNDALRRRIKALRERAVVREHMVRDELGYVRPGEVVLFLDEASQADAP